MNQRQTGYANVPIVIPAYEPDNKLVDICKQLLSETDAPVIVVNDGSGREYDSIFDAVRKEGGATVIANAVNLGKGRALKTAFNYLLNTYKDIIGCVTADSDGQHTPEDIMRVSDALIENPSSLVLGSRSFEEDGIPPKSRYGNKITRNVFKYLVGVGVTDTQTGLRGISADYMAHLLSTKGERYEFEMNMLIETKENSVSITEVPIATIYENNNAGSHFNPIKDSLYIYMTFAKFLFSSLSSSIIDLFLFTLFCNLFKRIPDMSAMYIMVSTVAARIISAAYNYMINYKVVFKSDSSIKTTGTKYAVLAVCQMMASAFLVNILYSYIGGAELACKIPVDIMLFVLSYFIQKEIVYK